MAAVARAAEGWEGQGLLGVRAPARVERAELAVERVERAAPGAEKAEDWVRAAQDWAAGSRAAGNRQ